MIFLKVGVVVIIVLLLKVIANQQEIDYHIIESKNFNFKPEDIIGNRGLINLIIFRIKVIIANIKYYFNKNESK